MINLFITLTLVFFITTVISLTLLWICRFFIIQMFGSIRLWLYRNRGYGFAYFYEPNRRLTRIYTKLTEDEITVKEKMYRVVPERIFEFQGIKSIMYNSGDANPIDPYLQHNESLENNPKFWSRFAKLIKMYYQTQTNESLVFWLVIGILLFVLLNVGLSGYLIYSLSELTTACLPAGVVSII